MGTVVQLLDTPEDPLRLAFSHLHVKRPGMTRDDGTRAPDMYEATFIVMPGGRNERVIQEAIGSEAKGAWGDNWADHFAEFADDQKGLRKGNLKTTASGEIYAGFEGNKYIMAKCANRPTVLNPSRVVVAAGDPGDPYAGCFVNGELEIWAQKPKPGVKRRINTTLMGVQFWRDGDAFGSGAAPSNPSSFPSLSTEDEKPAAGATAGAKPGLFD